MEILGFYRQRKIPRNLQRHMLRVADVGQFIARHWNSSIDEKAIVTTLLLHDLGNLLKFDFTRGLELLDEDERDLDYWKSVQRDLQEKYSVDEHEATWRMAQELGVGERILFLLKNMGSSNLPKTVESSDWELKVCAYADFRVGPFGFLTVQDRFADILRRYEGREHDLSDREKTLKKMKLCILLEGQLQPEVSMRLAVLPKEILEKTL